VSANAVYGDGSGPATVRGLRALGWISLSVFQFGFTSPPLTPALSVTMMLRKCTVPKSAGGSPTTQLALGAAGDLAGDQVRAGQIERHLQPFVRHKRQP
jgi:hypothetical protein